MHRTLIVFCIVFLIGIVLVLYKYHHRKSIHDNVEQLKKVITMTFNEAGKPLISKNRLIKGLKHHLGINEKMALKLVAKVRHEELIEIDRDKLKQDGTVEYRKTF